ncbi:PTS cellobiose transporter subunit IIB [Phyllobacterium sp. 21LDTY02-6]|jgi:glucitol/sorbitol PTS system EIIA component|uniref:PTS glucitol/sorbitol transporter subunit IIA n=1 Tax=unclassified Phyllobacterium TaxID=2638441 RepID=UPI0020204CD6|nr:MULTISPECIES: PTS glucitol/sorbitol transporter subunit IIA [unclassified Phyllobacterium]MCO4315886.1 PTS cellobiose transporter subunit IIB [Phyllobacterium sp. 21LDTY02-6]MCX8279690.1 PTS cellobiose transporter subunit IIB [Phyllobacterium sp. 0TCS1.6C]MCX8292119.1 PTS cellobiose transporter subunit IIB [Phyllobacterium sp. 0TCS1.6A]
MSVHLKTRITAVGPEVADLAEGGVVILFADGAPPELAEVSVLHSLDGELSSETPSVGTPIRIGDISAQITGMGDHAWQKVKDIGHVVITFNGSATVERPGEICASQVAASELVAALKVGTIITIG